MEEVQAVLEKLSAYTIPFVQQLSRRPGQKEMRYAHLLAGPPNMTEDAFSEESPAKIETDLEERVSKVERDLAEMKTAFDKLMKELMG